jgi:poly-gamma-glutamate capsule biosynthesis protein CapA/YwtB (metallophosphatase superfamily)
MIGRLLNEVLQNKPPEYPWGNTVSLFHDATWRFCNLECVLAGRWKVRAMSAKAFRFRSDATNVAVLKVAQIDLVSLANNHVLDFGEEAFLEMLDRLRQSGIRWAGAGRHIGEASAPAIFLAGKMRVGVIAFTDNEPRWEAEFTRPGLCHVPIDLKDFRAERLLKTIRKTKSETDLLFVSAHWGPNWGSRPPPSHVQFGHALIEAGADVVIGHSPHVFRAIEIYQNRPILYSAGDFIDDYAVEAEARNDLSFIFVLETDAADMWQLHLYPTRIRNFQAQLTKGDVARNTADRMSALCDDFETITSWDDEEACLEIRFQ